MGFRATLMGAAILACGLASGAHAASDPMIEGARQCTQNFPIQERQQGIPTHLLAAISSTESGRWHKELGMALPWPWTANVEGKAYYFASKAEAVARTQQFINQGKRSIDVGCMQVNLKHHPKAFRNLNEAYDPATNVAYSAKFLRTNYNDLNDWIKATAAYHSRTDYYGRQYLVRIEKAWRTIVTKVAAARANQGLTTQTPSEPKFSAKMASAAAPAAAPEARRMNRIDSTRNVKVIKIANDDRRSADVMVINRAPDAPIRVADASVSSLASNSDMIVKTSNGVNIASPAVDKPALAADSAAQASGPKFVFAN
jgi:hypothetical protein